MYIKIIYTFNKSRTKIDIKGIIKGIIKSVKE